MRIDFNDVVDSIYARSALGTLGEYSRVPLLHPDHSSALLCVVRDMFALLQPRLPAGVVVRAVDREGADVDITDKAVTPYLLAEGVRAALAAATLTTVSVAAGMGGDVINTLVENFEMNYTTSLITPVYY